MFLVYIVKGMNLIQIKQIDGLESALNSLSSSQYELGQEVTGSLESYDDYWNQLYWDEDHIEINSNGSTFDGDSDIALGMSDGGFSCLRSSYFKSNLTVKGDFFLTTNTGQLVYKDASGNNVRFNGAISPNYENVNSTSKSLTSDNYIVGVDTYSVSAPVYLTLPPPSAGKEIIIKDEGFAASAHSIHINPNSTEKIDNQIKAEISGSGAFLNIYSNGTDWFITNNSGIR